MGWGYRPPGCEGVLMWNWLQEQYLIWRSTRLRKATRKALREMKQAEKDFDNALESAKYYVKRENQYLDSKKGGKK